MFKKIGTIILLICYLTFSSGTVVFAFECSFFKHTHFSLLKNKDCTNYDCNCNKNHCKSKQNKNHQKNSTVLLIEAKCCDNSMKIFDLDIDEIPNFVSEFKFNPDFLQIDLLWLKIIKNNFANQSFSDDFFANYKINIPKPPNLVMVNYIHSITNPHSDNSNI